LVKPISDEFEDKAAIETLTFDNLECLRTAVVGISKGWGFALRDLIPVNVKKAPNAILMFWVGETDFYRPTISIEGMLSGYKITIWDIENFMTVGAWSRSHESVFSKVVCRIQTIARKESEYSAYARSIQTNGSTPKIFESLNEPKEGISTLSSRSPVDAVTWFPHFGHSMENLAANNSLIGSSNQVSTTATTPVSRAARRELRTAAASNRMKA